MRCGWASSAHVNQWLLPLLTRQQEENASLRLEIERLEALKAQVVHGSGGQRTVRSALYKQQRETELLRQAVREQRLLLARVQSGIAGNTVRSSIDSD